MLETPSSLQSLEQIRNLYRLTEAVSRARSLEEIYDEALNSLLLSLGVDRASVLLFDQEGRMRFKAWRGLSDEYRKFADGHSPWQVDAIDPQPVLVPDVQDDPGLAALRNNILSEGIRALAFIPLLYQGRLLGKFMLYFDTPHFFTEEEIQLAQLIASHISFAIERRRTEERLDLYRQIIAHSNEAIAIIDTTGRYLEQNAAHHALIGYTAKELSGQTPAIHMGAETFARVAAELAAQGVCRDEVLSRTKDGSARDIELSAFTVRNNAGEPVCYVGIKRDVTEQKRAQEVLRETNQTLAAVIQACPLAIITLDPEGRVKQWNPAAERTFGWSAAEVVGRPIPTIPPEKREEFDVNTSDAVRGKIFTNYETKRQKKDGSLIDVSISTAPLRDGNGEINGLVAIIHDITERKRAEAALRRSEGELSDFFENASVGLHWVGPDGHILRANRAELNLLGYAREEYIGRHISELHADRETINDILRRLHDGEELRDYEARLRCKDGSIKHVLIDSSVLWEDGKFIHTRCFTRDITERKRVEEEKAQLALQIEVERQRLDNIVSNVPGVVWEAWGEPDAATQRINFVSSYVETMLGYSVEEWLATPNFWLTIVHPEDQAQAARVAAEKFATTEGGVSQFRWVTKDGRVLWVEAQSVVVTDESGKPIGMRGVTMDITARKRAEEERAQLLERERAARAEAEEANRIKDEFLATLSHELRTPLTAMLGWTHMIRAGRIDGAAAAHALEVIERNAKAQQKLIEDILDLSRIITGKVRIELCPVDLRQVVAAVIEAVRPTATAKAIQLEPALTELPRTVLGDPNRLQQVVWNLLSNAVKFTPHGGRVQIRLAQTDAHAQLTVSDTGQGISPDFMPHVFDRFRQADSSSTRRHGGLGLGLAIARHLIELHGGAIQADSPGAGQGATFTINLPLATEEMTAPAAAEDAPPAPAAAEDSAAASCPPSLHGLQLLVVDDEADTLEFLTHALRDYGAQVTAVGSTEEALAALRLAPPDVMISDIGMPERDGYELIRDMRMLERERGGLTPAIALTAYAKAEDQERARAAGFQLHLAKPIEPRELAETIAQLVERNSEI